MLNHAKVKATKIEFRGAMLALFPSLGERKIDELWAQLRTEATVEEIADVARPIPSAFGQIVIDFSGRVEWGLGQGRNVIIYREDLDQFARADGFESWRDLLEFWAIHHFDGEKPTGQWSGVIVKWDSVTLPRVPDGQIEGGVKSQ